MARRTVMSQLASAGEEALGKIAQNSITHKALESALQLKDRVEKLVTGLADINGRVSRIEQRLAHLEKGSTTTTRARSTTTKASKTSTGKPRAAAKKKATS